MTAWNRFVASVVQWLEEPLSELLEDPQFDLSVGSIIEMADQTKYIEEKEAVSSRV